MTKKRLYSSVLAAVLLVLVLAGLLPGTTARAAGGDGTGSIGFYVQAVLPDNQLNENLTYFDLRVRAGQTQTLEVEVVNETAEAIVVDIAAVSASTNRNGVIDYRTPDIRDKTLQHPFSQLAALENSQLAIPALGTVTARVTVSLPAAEYDGVVLGGLVFTRRPEAPETGNGGMTLQNQYSYVIGVKLSETDAVVMPDFELESILGQTVNYQPALVHNIRNKNAAIAKDVDLHVLIRDQSGQVVGEARHTGIGMAPNSVMPLAVTPTTPVGEGGTTELLPGDYTSEVTLDHGGQSWTFEQKFTIGSVEAQQINKETVGGAVRQQAPSSLTTLFIVVLAAAAAIIAVLFVIIIRMLRRREEAKELNRLMRKRWKQSRMQEKYGKLFSGEDG